MHFHHQSRKYFEKKKLKSKLIIQELVVPEWHLLNEEMGDMKKLLFIYKHYCSNNKKWIKKQKGGFLSMLLGTLGNNLSVNSLTGNGKSKSIFQAGQIFWCHFIL